MFQEFFIMHLIELGGLAVCKCTEQTNSAIYFLSSTILHPGYPQFLVSFHIHFYFMRANFTCYSPIWAKVTSQI